MTPNRWAMVRLWVVLVLWAMAAGVASAQVDPRTWPRLDPSKVVAATKTITFDWPDGAGGDLSYGSGAAAVSEDGRFLYMACNTVNAQRGIAKIEIPAAGGRARVVAPCLGPTRADIDKILPSGGGGAAMIGGVLEQGGRMVVTAFFSYDANGQTIASHWAGPSLSALAGPFAGTVAPGLVKAQMGVIPIEWRALLGGPAFSTAGYTSIISRASYGAAFSVFDPATVTANGFRMTMLLGCPDAVPSCRTYGTPTSNEYNGSELSGGAFIAPGTRTLVVIEREASGPTCYGFTTRDPKLHGTPYPTAAAPDPTGVPWCYSLSDPIDQKGPKGYPYRLVAKLYDLIDLVDVRQGIKKPWDVKQYATVDLPGSGPDEYIQGGAFNPITGEYYLLRYLGGGVNTIAVYTGWGPGAASTPASSDCKPGTPQKIGDDAASAACVNGSKTITETWTRLGDVPATGTGAACSPIPYTVPLPPQACTVAPPPTPAPWSCEIRGISGPYADGDFKFTGRCDSNGAKPTPVVGTKFTVPRP